MKKYIITSCLILYMVLLNAQNKSLKLNEDICYCSGNTPLSIIKLDNNWDLLLSLRQPKRIEQLDLLKEDYTLSQLKLLEQWDLIEQNQNKYYQTSFPIFDSISSKALRTYSKQLASSLTNKIESDVLKLKSLLKKSNREQNIYSILFSYVIDGLVWDLLENENLVEKREVDLENPFWDGEFWTLYPKRDFFCGTNSISDKGYSIKVNWSEKTIPKMIPFINRFDLQAKILDGFITSNKVVDKEAISVFKDYNFFDANGKFTVPIIEENDNNDIYNISKEISIKIIDFIKSEIDTDYLKKKFHFKNRSQSIVILYHEVIWDVLLVLENENIIEKPVAFRDIDKAEPKNIGNLIILVKPDRSK